MRFYINKDATTVASLCFYSSFLTPFVQNKPCNNLCQKNSNDDCNKCHTQCNSVRLDKTIAANKHNYKPNCQNRSNNINEYL